MHKSKTRLWPLSLVQQSFTISCSENKWLSDHKPLEYIFNKPLHQAPLGLQRMLLSLQRYDLKIVYKPGTELFIADPLSRNYLEEMKETLVPELEVNDIDLTVYSPISLEMYQEVQKATAEDPVLQAVQNAVLEG